MRRTTVSDPARDAEPMLAVTLEVPGYREFTFAAAQVAVPVAGRHIMIEPGHASMDSELDIGALTIGAGTRRWSAALHGGRVTCDGAMVRILASAIEFADRIDVDRARMARADAVERLARTADDPEAALALRRAELRLAVASHTER